MMFFSYLAVGNSALPWEAQTSSELFVILQSIVQSHAVSIHRSLQGSDIGEEGEDFSISTQIVVPTALTHKYSSEPPAFPACTISYSWVKLSLLNQLLGNQGHRCVCWMCTIIFGWAVPVLRVQECSPLPLLWNATDFAWCLPPALGCWPTQPCNSSQVRETCGCQMCWVACDFCPYTVCLWARKPNLPNISQAFLDVKQPSQSSSISLSLDICKSAYFFCIQRVSPQSMHG